MRTGWCESQWSKSTNQLPHSHRQGLAPVPGGFGAGAKRYPGVPDDVEAQWSGPGIPLVIRAKGWNFEQAVDEPNVASETLPGPVESGYLPEACFLSRIQLRFGGYTPANRPQKVKFWATSDPDGQALVVPETTTAITDEQAIRAIGSGLQWLAGASTSWGLSDVLYIADHGGTSEARWVDKLYGLYVWTMVDYGDGFEQPEETRNVRAQARLYWWTR